MGDKDDGSLGFGLQLEQFVLHLGTDQRVEGREGLVHEQDVGVDRQATGQADPLLHAAGQFARQAVRPGIQPDLRQCFEGPLLPGRLVDTVHLQAEGGVLQDRHVRHQGEGLEDHAQLGAAQLDQLFVAHADDVLVIDQHLAGGRLDQPVQHAHHGRLARSRQAHDDEDLALDDVEAGVLHADRRAGLLEDLLLVETLLDQLHGLLRLGSEDLVEVLNANLNLCHTSTLSRLFKKPGASCAGFRHVFCRTLLWMESDSTVAASRR